ncbi:MULTISPECIES: HAD family hydrolase [unclassified Helicobacter]|uniref:HAD family hydrolase n=1 Tax=unclassified Helicobacter TaxID=2593540 RepID=UPI001F2DF689|nr:MULTISPECIES: HAD family hydrolase [unclassified Helicobacter]
MERLKNKVLLFDLDGTLIDSTDAICQSFISVFKDKGMQSPDRESIKSIIGYPLDEMFKYFGVRDKIEVFVQKYRDYYQEIYLQKTTMLPNAIRSLKEAYNFAELGVVTTKTAFYSKKILENFNVLELFKAVIGREDVVHPKPHAEPILKAMEFFNKDSIFYMIGDTSLDIQAAVNAGVVPIPVSSGYESRDKLQARGFRVFNDTLEAVLFIKES